MHLIIFDIDGTLTHSEVYHQKAFVETMKAMGVVEINQNWREYENVTDSYILKVNYENQFQIPFDLDLIPDFEKKMIHSLAQYPETTEIKGAADFIQKLKADPNFVFAYATGSLRKPAILKLKQAGIPYEEKVLADSNSIFEREKIVLSAIEKAKSHYQISDFESIISVGDGIWDWKTAKNLKIPFLGVGEKYISDFQLNNLKNHINNWENRDMTLFYHILNP